jgi:DNA-binding CsgD family transcriptional regulator/tetratricopeptide (TPR) repeat protein
MTVRVSSPVLVGRGEELAVLLGALHEAAVGRVRVILVEGEAGIGKTRLVREFEEDARASGAVVLHGGCVQLGRDDGLPFAPVTEALRGLLRERGIADLRGILDAATAQLAALVPELGRGSDHNALDLRPDWSQALLFEAVLVLLTRLGEEGPAVLVAEDLHWADRSTRDLIAFLALNLREERILLVGTYRSDELHRRHPLRAWAGEMDRLGVVRVGLERLGAEAVREQIEAIVGARPSAQVIEEIVARSGGNPFFVEELLAASGGVRLPASLRELLLARVAALPGTAQDLLGVAAVGGPVVDHDVLLAVAGIGDEDASGSLRAASMAHLIVPGTAGERSTYTFRHALLREAIYDDLLPRDRRRLHAEYARVLDALPEPTGASRASHLAEVAHHAEAAHDLPRALDGWLAAARAAYAVHAAAEATNAFSRCLDLWEAVPEEQRPSGVDLVDVLYEASFALNGTGDLGKARQMAARAVELEAGRDPQRSALLLERLGRTEWLDGDLVRATKTLERAVELVAPSPPSVATARVVGGLAAVLMLRGRASRAVTEARRAVKLARAVGSREAEAFALNTLGASLADLGRCADAVDSARRGLEIAFEINNALEIHRGYANLSTALDLCDRADEAIDVAREGVAWARGRGMWRLQGAFLGGNAAHILFHRGRWPEAEAYLRTDDDPPIEGVAVLNQALTAGPLALRTGRLGDARRILSRAWDGIDRLHDVQFTGPIAVGLAELTLAEGRPGDVAPLVDEALELMADAEDERYRAELMAVAVRAAAALAATATAARDDDGWATARDAAVRWVARLRAVVAVPGRARIQAHREGKASLATAEAELATLEGSDAARAWASAAQAWDELNRPFPAARCRSRQAEALLTAGERSEGAKVLTVAHDAAVAIGATALREDLERLAALARVPLARPTDDQPPAAEEETGGPAAPGDGARPRHAYDLTDRELQILPLLVAGATNRQIGEAMFISPSTAGVHVSRILGKMGVTNRVEAAAMALRTGLVE